MRYEENCDWLKCPTNLNLFFHSLQSGRDHCFPGGRALRNTSGRRPDNPGGLSGTHSDHKKLTVRRDLCLERLLLSAIEKKHLTLEVHQQLLMI